MSSPSPNELPSLFLMRMLFIAHACYHPLTVHIPVLVLGEHFLHACQEKPPLFLHRFATSNHHIKAGKFKMRGEAITFCLRCTLVGHCTYEPITYRVLCTDQAERHVHFPEVM